MDYFCIELCPTVDKSLCVLEDGPKGTQPFSYCMARGESAAAEYPRNAKWFMQPRWQGLELASLIANTANVLVVHRELKEVFEKEGPPVECYGFDLFDHKKRLVSRDYFIVNPIGTHDVLDLEASSILRSRDDPNDIVDVEEMVLDPRKVEKAPAFFRVKEEPQAIIITRDFGKKLAALQPTNFYARQVRLSA